MKDKTDLFQQCLQQVRCYCVPPDALPLPSAAQGLSIFAGACVSMGVITFLSMCAGVPILVASLGASACLIFCVPAAPFAQPRNVIGGQMLSAMTGVAVYNVFGSNWYAAALSVGAAIVVMIYSRMLHPPAAATALMAVMTGQSVWYPLCPVGLGAAVLSLMGYLINQRIKSVVATIQNRSKRKKLWLMLANTRETKGGAE